MVKKFNLTVSDELAEKIDDQRAKLGNLSALFQEAVSAKIRKQEEFKMRMEKGESMEATIERLKAEKAEAENDYRNAGVKAGLDWAKSSSYTDLQYMLGFNPSVGIIGFNHYINDLTGDDVLGEWFQDEFDKDCSMTSDEDGRLNDLAEQWFEGWKEGVKIFWAEVEGKL